MVMPHHNAGAASTQPSKSTAHGKQSGKMIRKRVKTGCLTCRKRRIKCGEQKPNCANCIKSGRDCDYSARASLDSAHHPRAGINLPYGHAAAKAHPDDESPSWPVHAAPMSYHSESLAGSDASPEVNMHSAASESMPMGWGQFPQQPVASAGNAMGTWPPDALHGMPPSSYAPVPMQATPAPAWYGQQPPVSGVGQYQSRLDTQVSPLPDQQSAMFASSESGVATGVSPGNITAPAGWSGGNHLPSAYPQMTQPARSPLGKYQPDHSPVQTRPQSLERNRSANMPPDARYGQRFAASSNYARPDFNNLLEVAAVEVQDDDYYDIFPDEVANDDPGLNDALGSAQRRSLQAVQQTSQAPGSRAFQMSPSGLAMDFYRVENAANPLRNPATARVFNHFVNYAGPALSVFERPVGHANPELERDQISEHRRTSWMYALPSLALHDNGLLHAMLALASFAMAKATDSNTTPSVKHHSWSIRRVHRSLSQPGKRQEVTTLAATLLLGFYEILTADHMKWSAHLAGAKQLILESPYRAITSKVLKLKAEQAQRSTRTPESDGSRSSSTSGNSSIPSNLADLDFNLIEKLVGRRLQRPEQSTRQSTGRIRHLSAPEWNDFGLFQDLYWFYVRQDMIHALISGNNLLLPYDQYASVLPRGPVGKADAAYGSFDHLMILMGRIADFAVRDRERKIRTIKAKRAQQAREQGHPPMGPDLSAGPRDASGMPFYGMAPTAGHAPMPHAYLGDTHQMPMPTVPPVPPRPPNQDHEPTARTAIDEWEEIQDSLKHFASLLGPDFRPLQEPEYPSFDTAFGRAALYSRYDIASLWMYYYMAMIVLIRAHPSHPPAAQIAVGAAAKETFWFAGEIGRIASGILPSSQPDLHPTFLGALASSMTPLFFAGVQYRDPAQRYWAVRRLCEISATCGWVTAEMCANGCETSWIRAADLGRGPPWERVYRDFGSLDPRSSAGRVNVVPQSNLDVLGKPKLQKAFGILGEVGDVEFEHLSIN